MLPALDDVFRVSNFGDFLEASSRISKPIPGPTPLITDGAYIAESRNGPTTRQTRFGGMIKALVLSSDW